MKPERQTLGFTFQLRKSGEVILYHEERLATTLRGTQATRFLAQIDGISPAEGQQLMARLTGNYKRGNERRGRNRG